MDYKAIESGKDYLSHHGVKGMRWGIRHDPERVGRVKRALAKIGSTTIKGLKMAKNTGKSMRRAAKRASYNRTQKKINKAIASGKADQINEVFSQMNDQQTSRAIMRMNQRDSIYRSRIEAGKRSLANAKLQRRVDTLKLRNEYKKQKHPLLNKKIDKYSDKLVNDLQRDVTKVGKMIISSATESGAVTETTKTAANKVYNAGKYSLRSKRLSHSDFVDMGKEYLSHYGVKRKY